MTAASVQPTVATPAMADVGLLILQIDDDDAFQAGYLEPGEMAAAAAIVSYLRDRKVLVTASDHRILVIVGQPTPQALIDRLAARAALVRAYLACPSCGVRHSLCPPFGWCWPCAETTRPQR